MHENNDDVADSTDDVPAITDDTSRRGFMSSTVKIGGSAIALSALGSGAVGALDDGAHEESGSMVTFTNQTSDGTSVTIDSASLPEGGFVAIHDTTLLEGDAFGSVIGVSELLESGDHENVEVTLFGDIPGAQFDQSSLEGTQPLIPMPHQNTNDNESYDFITSEGQEDGPYTKAGTPVVGLAFVTVQSETTVSETTTTQ